MVSKQLYINGKNAYATWGVYMDGSALSALMTPPPCKDFAGNSYRAKDGKRVVLANPRVADRDITLTFYLSADTEAEFLARYASFCEELATGSLVIRTSFQPKVYYRCTYASCTQFSEFRRRLASFALKLNEPDPTNRAETDKYATTTTTTTE